MAMIALGLKVGTTLDTGLEATCPPTWVAALAEPTSPDLNVFSFGSNRELRVLRGNGCALLSATIQDVPKLAALDFQREVCDLYAALGRHLKGSAFPHAVRLWNFIPRIHDRMGSVDGGLLDRYMVFNAGRYAGYTTWFGEGDVGPRAATATGIGHGGKNLYVYCLASKEPGRAIESPRQVPAYRYSQKRGPLPPVFARATVTNVNHKRMLLVGGTASVRGERSMHLGDVRSQTVETFRNLAALVLGTAEPTRAEERRALTQYETLRVYCVFGDDLAKVRQLVEEQFGSLKSVEYVRADVCRRTLLVEIEGTAHL